MSECRLCGLWAPDDPETGPDPSDLCPGCIEAIEHGAQESDIPEMEEEEVA